jgi:hypothetical protein
MDQGLIAKSNRMKIEAIVEKYATLLRGRPHPEFLKGIAERLMVYEPEIIREAFERVLTVKTFFPSLAEILEHIPKRRDRPQEGEDEMKKAEDFRRKTEAREARFQAYFGAETMAAFSQKYFAILGLPENYGKEKTGSLFRPMMLEDLDAAKGDMNLAIKIMLERQRAPAA